MRVCASRACAGRTYAVGRGSDRQLGRGSGPIAPVCSQTICQLPVRRSYKAVVHAG